MRLGKKIAKAFEAFCKDGTKDRGVELLRQMFGELIEEDRARITVLDEFEIFAFAAYYEHVGKILRLTADSMIAEEQDAERKEFLEAASEIMKETIKPFSAVHMRIHEDAGR